MYISGLWYSDVNVFCCCCCRWREYTTKCLYIKAVRRKYVGKELEKKSGEIKWKEGEEEGKRKRKEKKKKMVWYEIKKELRGKKQEKKLINERKKEAKTYIKTWNDKNNTENIKKMKYYGNKKIVDVDREKDRENAQQRGYYITYASLVYTISAASQYSIPIIHVLPFQRSNSSLRQPFPPFFFPLTPISPWASPFDIPVLLISPQLFYFIFFSIRRLCVLFFSSVPFSCTLSFNMSRWFNRYVDR